MQLADSLKNKINSSDNFTNEDLLPLLDEITAKAKEIFRKNKLRQ